MFDLLPLHHVPYGEKDKIQDECIQILNCEWPRSLTMRMRSIESSKDDFPLCLALVQRLPGHGLGVLGHVRLSRIPSIPEGVWVESVVIHPDLRGQGVGKYLMLRAEDYAKQRGFRTAYLCTIDRQAFYSRIGYSFCQPVCAYGGNIKLPGGITSDKPTWLNDLKPSKNKVGSKEKAKVDIQALKAKMEGPEGPNVKEASSKPTEEVKATVGEKPEPEKIMESLSIEEETLAQQCARIFKHQTLEMVQEPKELVGPLRNLAEDVKQNAALKKSEIHRMNLPKDFMKKTL